MKTNDDIAALLARLVALAEAHLSPPRAADFARGAFWRWEKTPLGCGLRRIEKPNLARLSDLIGVGDIVRELEDNFLAFLAGRAANHALLTGPRGCGKSSVVRGLVARHLRRGSRLIEIDADAIDGLPRLFDLLSRREEKFALFFDDLSLRAGSPKLSKLKSALEGGVAAPDARVWIVATSNRRRLLAESMADNLQAAPDSRGEIAPAESVEENISLSDRFGLWLPFEAPDAAHFWRIARHHLRLLKTPITATSEIEARRFATMRGSRNGRVARQFAAHIALREAAAAARKKRGGG